jgi:hypothetical protein
MACLRAMEALVEVATEPPRAVRVSVASHIVRSAGAVLVWCSVMDVAATCQPLIIVWCRA